MSATKASFEEFDFSGTMKQLVSGQIVKPILQNYLFDAKFPDYSLTFKKQKMERDPDGWFHPSTHPLMSERALYEYLAHPKDFPVEKKRYMSTFAVTMGKVYHEFIQMCLEDAQIRPAHLQVCTMCPPKRKCNEPGVKDEDTGARGHMDGILDVSRFPALPEGMVEPVFEFKTTGNNFGKLTKDTLDLDLPYFKSKWPVYYAQVQEYMRMTGKAWTIVLFMEGNFPWEMREYHVPFDPAFAQRIANKYRSVRQAVADGVPPRCCMSTSCPIKSKCEWAA